jgi:hypothetical protein
MKNRFITSIAVSVILSVIPGRLGAQVPDLGPDPVYGDWSGYAVLDTNHWIVSGDSMVTTVSGMTPRLDPGNDDWQWWNYPYHCAELAVIGPEINGPFELEAIVRMPDSTTTGYWDICLIFDYFDEYNYTMFTLWRNDLSCFYRVITGERMQLGDNAWKTFLEQSTGKNNYHNVRILRTGDRVSAFFNNEHVITTTDPALAGSGKLGIGTFNDSIQIYAIRAGIPPLRFSGDSTWDYYPSYRALNPGKFNIDTMDQDTLVCIRSDQPRLAPGDSSQNWWDYPYHAGNIAYHPTLAYYDFTLEAGLFKPPGENNNPGWSAGIIFGMESAYDYNILWLENNSGGTRLAHVSRGVREDLVFNPDSLFTDNDRHSFKIDRAGNIVSCYKDSTLILSVEDERLGARGMLGLGSIANPVCFDDVTAGGHVVEVSDSNILYNVSIGRIIGKTWVVGLPAPGVRAETLTSRTTLPAGATAVVMNDTFGILHDTGFVEEGMYLAVIAENGMTNLYTIVKEDSPVTIEPWPPYPPEFLCHDDLVIPCGFTIFMLNKLYQPTEEAYYIITDSSGNVLDPETEVESGMLAKIFYEHDSTMECTLAVSPATWPIIDIHRVDASNRPVIDCLFNDWNVFDSIPIDVPDTNLSVPEAADFSVHCKITWDENGLYMYFHFTDDLINMASEDPGERDGAETAILVTSEYLKRASYNTYWLPETRTWEQKYTHTYGMDQFDVISDSRDLSGCGFSWQDKPGGGGWELETFMTWKSLKGNSIGQYEFIPGPDKKISVHIAANDADEENQCQHRLHLWKAMSIDQDATDYAMLKLAGPITGIGEVINSRPVIYPNPVDDILYFSFNEPVEYAQIFNMLGQLVRTCQPIHNHSIDVSDLPEGLYLVKVTSLDGDNMVNRFIKK